MIKTISFLSFNITTADSDELKWFQLVLARKCQKIPKQDTPKKKIVYTIPSLEVYREELVSAHSGSGRTPSTSRYTVTEFEVREYMLSV